MNEAMPDRFQSVFRTHYPTVLRKLMNLVGERGTAEDLAQEVFLRLYKSPPSDMTVLGAWLHRVSTRVAYDYFRQAAKQRKTEHREISSVIPEASEPSSDWIVLRNYERATVKRVLQQLSERDRQVLLLRYSGYSYVEIAEIIGINVEIVGNVLRRALGRFKRKYQGEEGLKDEGQTSVEGCYHV